MVLGTLDEQNWPNRWTRLRRTVIVFAIAAGVLATMREQGRLWPGLPLLVLCVGGWTLGMIVPRTDSRRQLVAMLVLGVAGVLLTVALPKGPALAFPVIACVNAGARLPARWSVPLTVALALGFEVASAVHHWNVGWLIGAPGSLAIGLMFGLVRRQNDRLAAETQLTREEQARSAALAERARIAREIHDVLAHSLAALTVQLETADALLEGGRAEQARSSVVRAGQLAREGLAETRRAIGALRGETLPLPDLVEGLVDAYRADLDAEAKVTVLGEARPIAADTSLALYRTAQEAMTNIRKHAPGAPVRVTLDYRDGAVELTVRNGAAPDGAKRPLADAGGGYGLTGLRERAELAGGEFVAGPTDDGWQVDVRIPA